MAPAYLSTVCTSLVAADVGHSARRRVGIILPIVCASPSTRTPGISQGAAVLPMALRMAAALAPGRSTVRAAASRRSVI